MSEETLERIAIALERIADAQEWIAKQQAPSWDPRDTHEQIEFLDSWIDWDEFPARFRKALDQHSSRGTIKTPRTYGDLLASGRNPLSNLRNVSAKSLRILDVKFAQFGLDRWLDS